MGDILDMDNILTEDQAVSLFADEDTNETQESSNPEENKEEKQDDENKTTEVNPDELFEDSSKEQPESVGSEEESRNEEDTNSEEEQESPKNTYSILTGYLKDEGIFPDLDEDEIAKVNTPEALRDVIEKKIQSELNEVQKRVNEALNSGVEPNVITQYENTLGYLNNITEEMLNDEGEEGITIRRKLLQQDFMNRGYSAERAIKMTEKLFKSGDDIEEATQALEGNKEYFGKKYNEILDNAKKENEQAKKDLKKQEEALKKDILSSDKVFGSIELDRNTRQKVYDNVTKPVYKDPETGNYYTAIQKYKKDNENEFIKNVGLLYTLTNGFKNIDSLIKPQTKKEVKSRLKELEHTLNNTARNSNGTLQYVGSGSSKSKGSIFDNGFTIDIGNVF